VGKIVKKLSKYTSTDCFFGDFAHWVLRIFRLTYDTISLDPLKLCYMWPS